MPEAFKNHFNKKLIQTMASSLKRVSKKFDHQLFTQKATKNLQQLELKERSHHITQALNFSLPDDFKTSGKIILNALEKSKEGDLTSWQIMPLTHYVALYGQKDFVLSMSLLKEMTKRFTSEFSIRFFIINQPEKTLKYLEKWTRDKDHHVRRLVSEGTRPRLPWAMMLPQFIEDPGPIILLLEKLKDDESEYVRRSVANNLNDISKDHPDLIAKIARNWLIKSSPQRKKLIRHACRSLIKLGHKKTLKALGYKDPKIKSVSLKITTSKVQFGSSLEFELTLQSQSKNKQDLIIDFIIHHQKANGKTSPKVFKWKNTQLAASKTLTICKKHPMKKITTRTYYPGKHTIEIVINGVPQVSKSFELLMS
jgi:3-methyladenine DNA glycosylase AlkC